MSSLVRDERHVDLCRRLPEPLGVLHVREREHLLALHTAQRGQDLPDSAASANAIAASPNLVTAGRIDIPPDDDNTGNIEEHAANTGVGIRDNGTTLVMATVDGVDGCPMANATCGVNAVQLAFLMKDLLHVDDAMQMDQGGSTTMWVQGRPNDGVVSVNQWQPRRVFSALFVAYNPVSL